MTAGPADLVAAYTELLGLYRRQLEALVAPELDGKRVAELIDASGELLAGLPDPADLELSPALARELADLAGQAETARTEVVARLAAAGDALLDRLQAQRQRTVALRAYRRPAGSDPRFVDKSR